MAHSVRGSTCEWQVKLCEPHAIQPCVTPMVTVKSSLSVGGCAFAFAYRELSSSNNSVSVCVCCCESVEDGLFQTIQACNVVNDSSQV